MRRRQANAILAALLIAAVSGPGLAGASEGREDHEIARSALLRGEVMPVQEIVEAARALVGDDVLGWGDRAAVEPLPESAGEVFCARCKKRIPAGAPAVKCPQCGAWHHSSDDLPCWTYAETCAFCDQPTALDADYRFTPEDL